MIRRRVGKLERRLEGTSSAAKFFFVFFKITWSRDASCAEISDRILKKHDHKACSGMDAVQCVFCNRQSSLELTTRKSKWYTKGWRRCPNDFGPNQCFLYGRLMEVCWLTWNALLIHRILQTSNRSLSSCIGKVSRPCVFSSEPSNGTISYRFYCSQDENKRE